MQRGANVALTREIPDLTGVVLGRAVQRRPSRSWPTTSSSRPSCATRRGKALSDRALRLLQPARLARAVGDAAARAAIGEDTEQIEVDLHAVPAEVSRIVVVVYLNEGIAARRSLGQLREAASSASSTSTGNAELVRSENLAPALSTETGAGARRALPAPGRVEVQGHRRRATTRASPGWLPTTGCRCEHRQLRDRAAPRTDLPWLRHRTLRTTTPARLRRRPRRRAPLARCRPWPTSSPVAPSAPPPTRAAPRAAPRPPRLPHPRRRRPRR